MEMPADSSDHQLQLDGAPVRILVQGPRSPDLILVLGHGASGTATGPPMRELVEAMAARGILAMAFNFPYAEQGRRTPPRAEAMVGVYREAVAWARSMAPGLPLAAGGRSYGGRVATLAAAAGEPLLALACFAYPLHAPGRPERERSAHLPELGCPLFVCQGTADPFAQPPQRLQQVVTALPGGGEVVWVEGAGHDLKPPGQRGVPAPALDRMAALLEKAAAGTT